VQPDFPFLGGGWGVADPEATHNIGLILKLCYPMKIMSKSPSPHTVMLQVKLNLTEKENNLHICEFLLLYFSKF
jgi:hypothetical protein